jgi:hypothetical protein
MSGSSQGEDRSRAALFPERRDEEKKSESCHQSQLKRDISGG